MKLCVHICANSVFLYFLLILFILSGALCVRIFVRYYRVYENYPYLLAEMYAFSMAAAHENLPHLQIDNHMVSAVDAPGEGWPHVDALPEICVPPDEEGMHTL